MLLAAIVEIVSGQSYGDFLRQSFFAPAGMERTGFYGEDLGHGVDQFAVGYGMHAVGDPNVPPNWGPTSWLAMGSGGMFSTPGDVYRFIATLQKGGILKGEHLERYLAPGVGAGASDRGFFFVRAWNGVDTGLFFASNVFGETPVVRRLADTLIHLVMNE